MTVKKLICLLLALTMLLAPCALAEEDNHTDDSGEMVENPIHDVESREALEAATPGVNLPVLPEDVDTVMYSYIHGEPMIAQIQFNYDGDFYTLRAAALPEGGEPQDIDGIYLVFDEEDVLENLYEGTQDKLRVLSSTEEAYALCSWTRTDLNTQYSLFSETAGEPEMPIIFLAAALIIDEADWEIGED